MCEKDLRAKIASLSEYQAKVALYELCSIAPIMTAHIKRAVETAQMHPRCVG